MKVLIKMFVQVLSDLDPFARADSHLNHQCSRRPPPALCLLQKFVIIMIMMIIIILMVMIMIIIFAFYKSLSSSWLWYLIIISMVLIMIIMTIVAPFRSPIFGHIWYWNCSCFCFEKGIFFVLPSKDFNIRCPIKFSPVFQKIAVFLIALVKGQISLSQFPYFQIMQSYISGGFQNLESRYISCLISLSCLKFGKLGFYILKK